MTFHQFMSQRRRERNRKEFKKLRKPELKETEKRRKQEEITNQDMAVDKVHKEEVKVKVWVSLAKVSTSPNKEF